MNKKTITKTEFNKQVLIEYNKAKIKYNRDWDKAYMFSRPLPTKPNIKVIEATLKENYNIK